MVAIRSAQPEQSQALLSLDDGARSRPQTAIDASRRAAKRDCGAVDRTQMFCQIPSRITRLPLVLLSLRPIIFW
jgi:hypothetical protein